MPGAWKYGLEKLARDFPFFGTLAANNEELVGAGRKPALDGKNIAKPQLVGVIDRRPGRKLRPLARMRSVSSGTYASLCGFSIDPAKESGAVSWRRRGLPEYDDSGGH